MTTPRPGDFGLVSITGTVGRLIRVGQYLNGDGYTNYEHAFVVIGGGMLLEAEPGGARIRWLTQYDGTNVVYSGWPLTDVQRARIVEAAHSLVGTPYSILDYLSLTLVRLHIQPGWVARYVANTGHMICSQLVDECYLRAGVHLFDDGRIAGDVTPVIWPPCCMPRRHEPDCGGCAMVVVDSPRRVAAAASSGRSGGVGQGRRRTGRDTAGDAPATRSPTPGGVDRGRNLGWLSDAARALTLGLVGIPTYLVAVLPAGPSWDDLPLVFMVGPPVVLLSVFAGRESWLMLRARRVT